MSDLIISRMNDFQRILDFEPWNYSAILAVRLCADLLFRLGVSFVRVDGGQWKIIKC